MKRLSDNYLLVALTSKQPKATTKSEKARQAAIAKMKAEGVDALTAEHVAKAQIDLWPDGQIREVMNPFHAFNTYHRRVTVEYLPGKVMPKLLSIHKQAEHSQKYFNYKLAHQQMLSTFVARYAEIQHQIELAMGEWYDPSNYPAPEAVERSFAFEVRYLPLADPSAFELGAFSEAQAADLERQLRMQVDKAAQDATREYRDRLREAVSNLASKMRGGDGVRMHASLITNLEELLDANLNVAEHEGLDTVIKSATWDMSTVKKAGETKDPATRQRAADKLEQVASRLQMLF